MAEVPSAECLRHQLKRRGVHLNTLHATLRLATLAPTGKHYQKERETRLLKLVTMLGGIREPDLVAISRLTQPTIWRLVQRWQSSGAIRVVADYKDGVAGRQAKWLQPPGSTDLPDGRRAYLVETASLIKAYIPLWEAEQAQTQTEPAPPPLELPRQVTSALEPPDPAEPPRVQAPPAIAALSASTAPAAAPVPQPEPVPVAPLEASLPAATVAPEAPVQRAPTPARADPVTLSVPPEPLPVALQPLRPYVPPPVFVQRVSTPPPAPSYSAPQMLTVYPCGSLNGREFPARPRFPFPWWYLFKLTLGTLLLSAVLALVLRFGVTVAEWLIIWGIAALWVLAGGSILGLVVVKKDEWGNPYEPMHQVLVRAAVVLGLVLILWPSGLAQAAWRSLQTSAPAEQPRPIVLPPAPPRPLPVPTTSAPPTCGQVRVNARLGLRLRTAPSTDAAIITKLDDQSEAEFLCENHDAGGILWAQVRAGEHTGWVAAVEGQAQYLFLLDNK